MNITKRSAFSRLIKIVALVVSYLVVTDVVFATGMLGDTAAVSNTPSGATENPANAAHVDRTTFQYDPSLFQSSSLKLRYPGNKPVSSDSSGVSLMAIPSFVYKVNQKLGIAGAIIPPLPIGLPIEVKEVPLVVLGNQAQVDLKGEGGLNGLLFATVGYQVSNTISVGAAVNFMSANFKIAVTPSEGGDPLLNLNGTLVSTDVIVGARYKPNARLELGVATSLFSSSQMDIAIDSALTEESPGGGGGSGTAISNILVGMKIKFSKLRLNLDGKFTRAPEGATDLSLADLQTYPKEVHNTFGVRAGATIKMSESNSVLLGFRYEPSGIGAGSREDGLAGFGTMDVINLYLPVAGKPLQPYWKAGGGIQTQFGKKRIRSIERVNGKKKVSTTYFNQWIVAGGFTYQKSSLGINENGSLPGAYVQNIMSIPLRIVYRM